MRLGLQFGVYNLSTPFVSAGKGRQKGNPNPATNRVVRIIDFIWRGSHGAVLSSVFFRIVDSKTKLNVTNDASQLIIYQFT